MVEQQLAGEAMLLAAFGPFMCIAAVLAGVSSIDTCLPMPIWMTLILLGGCLFVPTVLLTMGSYPGLVAGSTTLGLVGLVAHVLETWAGRKVAS